MRWFLTSLAALLLLGCATPTDNDDLEPGLADLTITNGLEWRNITDVLVRLLDESPSWERLGPVEIEPGESVDLVMGTGAYDIRCEAEAEATYTCYDIEITEEGYTWEITPEDKDKQARLTITNGITYDIKSISYSWDAGSIDWDEYPLEPGASIAFTVECSLYSLSCFDELGSHYARYDVEITEEGYTWIITMEDLRPQ